MIVGGLSEVTKTRTSHKGLSRCTPAMDVEGIRPAAYIKVAIFTATNK
jgi:hypothetical protein